MLYNQHRRKSNIDNSFKYYNEVISIRLLPQRNNYFKITSDFKALTFYNAQQAKFIEVSQFKNYNGVISISSLQLNYISFTLMSDFNASIFFKLQSTKPTLVSLIFYESGLISMPLNPSRLNSFKLEYFSTMLYTNQVIYGW
ncbi:Hypothetical_protein [Hexamita inflata]|uniref:Hypothetical_protein n=1 Tax=Hexamita inflata TaxID=28002 RepID=A0ABP1HLI8_9EUKA